MPDKGSVFVVGDYIIPIKILPVNRALVHVKTNLFHRVNWLRQLDYAIGLSSL
jgi:hypothetical protein